MENKKRVVDFGLVFDLYHDLNDYPYSLGEIISVLAMEDGVELSFAVRALADRLGVILPPVSDNPCAPTVVND